MKLLKEANAGTLESSDVYVTVAPSSEGNHITLESSVDQQYGESIIATINEVLENLEVEGAIVNVNDQGALDCTIKARVETALFRSADVQKNIAWGTSIK